MIAFKDFLRPKRMLGLTTAKLPAAVEDANSWIAQEGVDVINMETIYDTTGQGGKAVTTQDGVRVWYRRQ